MAANNCEMIQFSLLNLLGWLSDQAFLRELVGVWGNGSILGAASFIPQRFDAPCPQQEVRANLESLIGAGLEEIFYRGSCNGQGVECYSSRGSRNSTLKTKYGKPSRYLRFQLT